MATSAFLDDLAAQGYRPSTLHTYRIALGPLGASRKAIRSTADLLACFPAELGPASKALYLTAARSFERWCLANGWIPARVLDDGTRIRLDRALPRPLTAADLDLLRGALRRERDARLRLLFALLYETGLRIGEALAIRCRDVCLEPGNEGITVRRTKGRTDRVVPLVASSPLARLLRLGLGSRAPDDYLLHPGGGGRSGRRAPSRPWLYTSARAAWARLQARAGLPEASPHRLRHTRATDLHRQGMGLLELQRFLGHAKPETTARYVGTDESDIRAALGKLSN